MKGDDQPPHALRAKSPVTRRLSSVNYAAVVCLLTPKPQQPPKRRNPQNLSALASVKGSGEWKKISSRISAQLSTIIGDKQPHLRTNHSLHQPTFRPIIAVGSSVVFPPNWASLRPCPWENLA